MIWLGTMTPVAATGLRMKDNGVCAVSEDRMLLAVSEERLTRAKHDHQHRAAFAAVRRALGSDTRIAGVGISSCSDAPWSAKTIPSGLISERAPLRPVPSHHYSHALSAFLLSPFRESLVVVSDAGGNTFHGGDSTAWWKLPREQTTVWIGQGGEVHLVERPHFGPEAIGWGEWFRAFTYFLGWPSHTLSGNTMALAAYGDPSQICDEDLLEIAASGAIRNEPHDPVGMVSALLRRIGKDNINCRATAEAIQEEHGHLAAFLQRDLTRYFVRNTLLWLQRYSMMNVCLSGGTAQNCVMAAQLASAVGHGRTYVSPFSGDVGQCVGNALYARRMDLRDDSRPQLLDDTFLGTEDIGNGAAAAVAASGLRARRLSQPELSNTVGAMLAHGHIVAIATGRAEFGPRALGHRSVLGDPLNEDIVSRIKHLVKRRDDFMPLAPAVHRSMGAELESLVPISSTMVFAPKLPEHLRAEFGASCHVDGTARIQTIEPNNRFFSEIANAFQRHSGRRVLLNTSFNRRGDPMVESAPDAISAFMHLDIDTLVLHDFLITADTNFDLVKRAARR